MSDAQLVNTPEVGKESDEREVKSNLLLLREAMEGIKDENIEPGSVFTRHIVPEGGTPYSTELAWKDVVHFEDDFPVASVGAATLGVDTIMLPSVGGVPTGETIDCRDVSLVVVIASIPQTNQILSEDTHGFFRISVDTSGLPFTISEANIQAATEQLAVTAGGGALNDKWIIQMFGAFEPTEDEHHVHLDALALSFNLTCGISVGIPRSRYKMTVITVRT